MKSHRATVTLHLPERTGFVNITPDVEEALMDSGIQEGLCLVNAMHITACVFINDDEPGLHQDYARWLERLAPFNPAATRARAATPTTGPARTTGTPTQAPDHGAGGGGGGYQGEPGLRTLGTDLLRRVRREAGQAGADKIIGE